MARAVADAARPLSDAGRTVLVVSSPAVRAPLRQILHPHLAGVVVLGYNELADGFDVQSVGLVQLPAAGAATPASPAGTPVGAT